MQSYYQREAAQRIKNYEAGKAQGIEIGNLIRVQSGYRSSDGICKVLSIKDHPKHMSLTFTVKRLIKADGTLVKNSKTTYGVDMTNATKVNPDILFEEALKAAEEVRNHLLVNA